MRISLALAVVMAFSAAAYGQGKCPPSPDYSYKGAMSPEHWGEQWPVCGKGQAQSPIDIPAAGASQKGPAIQFHYQPFDLDVENTSHVIEVVVPPGSYIMVGDHRYDLVQFHFHTPSEHQFGGKAADLEIHFVHRDSAGKLAVVGLLASKTGASAALQPVVATLPINACDHKDVHRTFDAAAILPAVRDYATYPGSLTTPGCDEGVTWFVLTRSISVSPEQLTKLSPFGADARPVQPVHGRAIVRVKPGQ